MGKNNIISKFNVWMVISFVLLLFIFVSHIVGAFQNHESEQQNYIYIKDNQTVFMQNGGMILNLSVTGEMENCNSMTMYSVLCGKRDAPGECWQHKKDKYVGKEAILSGCCHSIDGINSFCCDTYATGVLSIEDDEEVIGFEGYYYKCYFRIKSVT